MATIKSTHLCGGSLLGLGVFFSLSSHLHFEWLLQPPPSTWPIPYESSLCLELTGIAFLVLLTNNLISKVFGFVIFGFGIERCMDYFLNISILGFQNGEKMHLLAAIGFMLIGLLLFIWRLNSSIYRQLSLIFSCAALIILGSFSLCLPHNSIRIFEPVFMHFYVALGFLFIGTTVLHAIFNKKPADSWKQLKHRDRSKT